MLRVLAILFFREEFFPFISSVEKMGKLRAELLVQVRRIEKFSKADCIRDVEVSHTDVSFFDVLYQET